MGFGITKLIKSNYRLTSSIEKSIRENCNCDSVEKNISTAGFQFSLEDGINNQTASFILNNCKYEDSVKEKAGKINKYLNATVKNYGEIDLLELTFKANGESKVVKIKNGIIL